MRHVSMRKCGRSCNHGYITKLIEDGLKGWVIEDDDRKHVKGIYQGFWQGEGVKVRVREET